MSERSAQRFMSVAENLGDKSVTVSHLHSKVLYALAAPSTPQEVRDEVIEKAEQGESVTLKELKELKEKYQSLKSEADKTQQSLTIQKNVLTQFQQAKDEAEQRLHDLIESQEELVAKKAAELAEQLAQAKIAAAESDALKA